MSVQPDQLITAALRQHPGLGDDPATQDLTAEDAATLEAFRRVVATARAVTDDDRELDVPLPDVWSAIEFEAFDGPAGGSAGDADPPLVPPGDPVADERPSTPVGMSDRGVGSPARPEPGDAEVIDLASRRARRSRTAGVIGAVAAAAVLIAAVGGVLVSRSSNGSTELVASADLSLLAGGGSGAAELVERDDGLYLVVDVSDLEPAENADFFELWMLAPDVSDMASMTKFTDTSGQVEVRVPDGVDPSALPVVDISEELDDGDDTHSGLSILRGELT